MAYGILFPDQQWNQGPQQWNHRVLTTGPLGNSLYNRNFQMYTKVQKPFTAALFTIARTWKQPKCPSTEEWIKKVRYIYTREYYSAIKRNKITPLVATWMNLEPIIPNEVSQKRKNIIFYSTYMESSKMVLKNLFTGQQWEKEMATRSSILA